jgi:AAHS family 4-hydroxybenzoate transporter-like MFS transporter
MLAIASAGLFVIGSQFGMNALAAAYYPTVMRASGVGWALGIGRIGSIVGPVLGGYLLAQSWNVNELLLLSALPSALAAIAVAALYFTQPAVTEGRHTTARKAVAG